MAKFRGVIGFVRTEETSRGVFKEVSLERPYSGDILRDVQNFQKGEHLNDNFIFNNRFSIVADGYAYENYEYMRYITWAGSKLKIIGIETNRPRLILTVGGVYNG